MNSKKKWKVLGGCLAFLFIATMFFSVDYAKADGVPSIVQQDLFEHEGTVYQRLPGIIVTTEGTLIVTSQWRKDGLSDFGNPTDIVVKRSTDGGETWSSTVTVFDGGSDWAGGLGPIIQDETTGDIFITFIKIPVEGYGSESTFFYNCAQSWTPFYIIKSEDDGVTWSSPTSISVIADAAGSYATPGNNCHGIQLSNGRLIIPAWVQPYDDNDFQSVRTGILYSDDHGSSWHVGAIGPLGSGEASVAETIDGQVYLNWRHDDCPNDQRGWSISNDNGETFSQSGFHSDLVNPSVHAGLVRYSTVADGGQNILLFSNPKGPSRTNMNVRYSYDEGSSWSAGRLVYDGVAGYSDLAVGDDGTIYCVYEADYYTRVRIARFNWEWLAEDIKGCYEGDALPSASDPEWIFTGTVGATETGVASVSQGILTLERTTPGRAYWTKEQLFDRTNKGATADMRTKVSSSSTVPIELTVETGDSHIYALNIFKDSMAFWNGTSDVTIATGQDNYSAMHTYRLVILPGATMSERDVEIYRDGVLISTQEAASAGSTSGMVKWGKGWGAESLTAEVDYVSYDASGAYRPVLYEGDALPSASDPEWIFTGTVGATETGVASVSQGILTLERTTPGRAYWTKEQLFDRTNKGATADMRTKVSSSSTVPIELTVETGDSHIYALNIFKDSMTFWNGTSDVTIATGQDNYSAMHTYRLVILPGATMSERDVEIYRDGVLISTQEAASAGSTSGMVKWGKGWGAESLTAEVDYVSYDASGAYRP